LPSGLAIPAYLLEGEAMGMGEEALQRKHFAKAECEELDLFQINPKTQSSFYIVNRRWDSFALFIFC
jgi:hypothetical protein